MGTANNNTKTVIEMVRKVMLEDGVIDAAELPRLFHGKAPVNVHAKVPGVYRAGTDPSDRRNLLSIYEIVTANDSPFDDNFKGYVRAAFTRGNTKPGRDVDGAVAAIKDLAAKGGIITAAQLDPAAARRRRGRELVAAVRTGGRSARS